jgi:hypothetical protein
MEVSMRRARFVVLAFFLPLMLWLPLSSQAQTQTGPGMTNADIVKMLKAGVPESIIVRAIQGSGTTFNTSADALIDLRKHGASEPVLGALLDRRSAPAPATVLPGTPAAASGPPRLPNLQADLKIKSHSLAKISMSQNHIKVEEAGAPLFDLKWKEKPSH